MTACCSSSYSPPFGTCGQSKYLHFVWLLGCHLKKNTFSATSQIWSYCWYRSLESNLESHGIWHSLFPGLESHGNVDILIKRSWKVMKWQNLWRIYVFSVVRCVNNKIISYFTSSFPCSHFETQVMESHGILTSKVMESRWNLFGKKCMFMF